MQKLKERCKLKIIHYILKILHENSIMEKKKIVILYVSLPLHGEVYGYIGHILRSSYPKVFYCDHLILESISNIATVLDLNVAIFKCMYCCRDAYLFLFVLTRCV